MTPGRVGVIVAARTASSRLPGKALLALGGLPMIVFMLRRLGALKRGTLVLATTELASDDQLAAIVAGEGIPVFRGAGADVVRRYGDAARHFGFETIVRLTGDCPFLDAAMVDGCIADAEAAGPFDIATTKGAYPVGLDAEIYEAALLARLDAGNALTAQDREHLTLRLYRNPGEFLVRTLEPPPDWPKVDQHFTVDTPLDYENACAIVTRMGSHDFSVQEMLEALA